MLSATEKYEEKVKEDKQLLISLSGGRIITDDEYKILVPYFLTGLVRFGFSFIRKEITAFLTEKGKGLIGLDI